MNEATLSAGKPPADLYCSYCGEITPADARTCMHCGHRLYAGCHQCGSRNPRGATRCAQCGQPLRRPWWRRGFRVGRVRVTYLHLGLGLLAACALWLGAAWYAQVRAKDTTPASESLGDDSGDVTFR
jgi:ribosomal protein L40E